MGEYFEAVTPADIAPTFAALCGVTLAARDGRVLAEALQKTREEVSWLDAEGKDKTAESAGKSRAYKNGQEQGRGVGETVDLTVQVGALRLQNPIIAASGTFGYGVEFAHLVDLNRLGGLVTKGISLEPIEGAPSPRLCETPSGMLNAVGLQNVGVEAFVRDKLPLLRKYNTQVIVNVFGYCLEEYVRVIERLEDAEGIAAYELNISCPNVKKGGMQFGADPAQVGKS